MKIVKSLLGVFAILLLMQSCKQVDFQKTKGGVAYKLFPGKGNSKDSLVPGNIIKYNVIRRVVGAGKKDTVIQNTHESMPSYEDIRPSTGTYFDGFTEMLAKAKVGDSIYYEQVLDSFIAKQPDLEKNTPFRKGDKLISEVRILSVFKTPDEAQEDFNKERSSNSAKLEAIEMKKFQTDTMVSNRMAIDSKIIEEHLKANNISQFQKSPWGAYVQVLNPGAGDKPKIGQFVQVKYTGTTLAGAQFDAGVYPLQFGFGGSIKGFEEGVRFLGKGGKAKVFVPSMLAYGPQERGEHIKPFQILVFDLEVLDISDAQVAQNPATPDTGSHEGHNH